MEFGISKQEAITEGFGLPTLKSIKQLTCAYDLKLLGVLPFQRLKA